MQKNYADLFPSALRNIHPGWQASIFRALERVPSSYLDALVTKQEPWLPGAEHIFNAFSLAPAATRYILFGESPYPRVESANGYAFWDANVSELFSPKGLSTQVNRATSLRNMLKAMLLAKGLLAVDNLSQEAIAKLDKSSLAQTGEELFHNFLQRGIMLLNASLVLDNKNKNVDAKAWLPFMQQILQDCASLPQKPTLLLFGKIAEKILTLPEADCFEHIVAEHPYNISFITNPKIQRFLSELDLLQTQNEYSHEC